MAQEELPSVSYNSFSRSDPQIRQLCLFTFSEGENLHSSEKTILSRYPLSFLNSRRQCWANLISYSFDLPWILGSFVTYEENVSILFAKKCHAVQWCTPKSAATIRNDTWASSSNSCLIRTLFPSLIFRGPLLPLPSWDPLNWQS